MIKTFKNLWFYKVFANSVFWYHQAVDGPFGLVLAPAWAVWDLSWAVLGLSWGCLGPSRASWGNLDSKRGLKRRNLTNTAECVGAVEGTFRRFGNR